VLVDDYRTEVEPTGYIDPAAYGSTIGVPVVARGELLGALVIQSAADSRR